ncbi:MAG: sensor histidine kinase, partial [Treponema sp.]|nr:sensor histidine kinase [Treponema sp.]
RFYKGDKARTRQGDKSGAGLGLSIAKTLCKLLDADISAQNAGSGGAHVTITVYNSFTEEL